MSKADLEYAYGRAIFKQHYALGAVAWYKIWRWFRDLLVTDCSGYMIGLWRRAGVLFLKDGQWVTYDKFFGTKRPTANIIWRKVTKITQPSKFGDLGFHVRKNGTAYHVFKFVGLGKTFEAGDGTGHVAEHTVKWQNDRRAVWGYLTTDEGERTPPGGPFPVLDWPVMERRFRGDTVREAKALLNQLLGCYLTIANTLTGKYFGRAMEVQVNRFRTLHGLKPNGMVDADFIGALMEALSALR